MKEPPDNSDHSEGEGVEEGEEEERKRARIDDLWASFKQNTGTKTHSATDTKARCRLYALEVRAKFASVPDLTLLLRETDIVSQNSDSLWRLFCAGSW